MSNTNTSTKYLLDSTILTKLAKISNGKFILLDDKKSPNISGSGWNSSTNSKGIQCNIETIAEKYNQNQTAKAIGLIFGDDYLGFDCDSISRSEIEEIALRYGWNSQGDVIPPTFTISSYNDDFRATDTDPDNPLRDSKGNPYKDKCCYIFYVPQEKREHIYFKGYGNGEIRYKYENGNYCQSVVFGYHPTTKGYKIIDDSSPTLLPDWLYKFAVSDNNTDKKDNDLSNEFVGDLTSNYANNTSNLSSLVHRMESAIAGLPTEKIISLFSGLSNATYSLDVNTIKVDPPYRDSVSGLSLHIDTISKDGSPCLKWYDWGYGFGAGLIEWHAFYLASFNMETNQWDPEKSQQFFTDYQKSNHDKARIISQEIILEIVTRMANLTGLDKEWYEYLQKYQERQERYKREDAAKLASQLEQYNQLKSISPNILEILGDTETSRKIAEKIAKLSCDQYHIDPIISLMILLTNVASLCKAHTALRQHNQIFHNPILFHMLVADSSVGKTPLINEFKKPLDRLSNKSNEEFNQRYEQWELECLAWEAKNKKRKGSDDEPLTLKPKEPKRRSYIRQDYTPESLIASQEPFKDCGSLIYKDEAATLLSDRYGKASSENTIREKFKKFWDGDGEIVERKNAKLIALDRTSFSFLGAIQTQVIERIQRNDRDNTDGLWQRFIYSIIPIPGRIQEPEDEPDYKVNFLQNELYKIYDCIDKFSPYSYELDPDCKPIKQQWRDRTEDFRLNEIDPVIRSLSGKYGKYAYRITLILHILKAAIEGKEPDPIVSVKSFKDGIAIADYYLKQATQLFKSMLDSDNSEDTFSIKINRVLNRLPPNEPLTLNKIQRIAYNYGKYEEAKNKTLKLIEAMVKNGDMSFTERKGDKDYYQIIRKPFSYQSTIETLVKPDIEPMVKPAIETLVKPDIEPLDDDIDGVDDDDSNDNTGYYDKPDIEPKDPKPSDNSIKPESEVNNVEINDDQTPYIPTTKLPLNDDDDPRILTESKDINSVVNKKGKRSECTKYMEIDQTMLNLNYKPNLHIKDWRPDKEILPWDSVIKIYLDIETTGLDPEKNRVIMIGVLINKAYTIISNQDEKVMLKELLGILKNYSNACLIGHNIFNFDLPFLVKRYELNNINHPIEIDYSTGIKDGKEIDYGLKRINHAKSMGKPIQFRTIRIKGLWIIDTYQQVAIYDYSSQSLLNYKLKSSVIALGLREDQRLELSNDEIQSNWISGNLSIIEEYLRYDLDDTELLADRLLPIIWYQTAIVPLNNDDYGRFDFQNLAIASVAKKIHLIHQKLLGKNTEYEPDIQHNYQGAKTKLYLSGIHKNLCKLDVSSLYPSLMLRYGLCSRKDPERKFLDVLFYMTKERLRLKKLAKTDPKADHEQNSLKILINGSYGYFGTKGYQFNDYQTASIVTAYGRRILELMEATIESNGGVLIESDTDGVIFSSIDPEKIKKAVDEILPDGIKVDLEFTNSIGWIKDCVKNYLILIPGKNKPLIKGVKRDDIPLFNEFRLNFLEKYIDSRDVAETYKIDLVDSLIRRTINIEKLSVNRTIKKNEKTLVDKGFGKIGDKISFYYGNGDIFKSGKNKGKFKAIVTQSGDFNLDYYLNQIEAIYKSFNLPSS